MSGLLQDFLVRQAERRPERVALVFRESRVSYGQLEEESGKLARVLRELGCRPGDRVVLAAAKSPAAILGMIASLKAGCAYVPVDVESPAARVERIVRAVEPRAVLVGEGAVPLVDALVGSGALASSAVIVSVLDRPLAGERFETVVCARDWADGEGLPPLPRVSPNDPAHILFTSGSTGEPKGVVVTHASVCHFVEWAIDYFGATAEDRFSGHAPLHFDLSTFDLFGALAAGAELHLVPPERTLLPHRLADFIREAELTQWFAVPSTFTLLAAADALRERDFPSLERVLWCGEVLPPSVLRYWMERVPHASFTNLYGPTETTIASSFHTVSEPPRSDEPIPIGVACPGEELLLLDDELRPVAPGELGEIVIGGVGVSPGYWRDEERTREAFVLDPRGSGSRLYRTGDLGRVGPDGLLYFHGRKDCQIKHRGYRIELGEVEHALTALQEVAECAVVAIETDGFPGTEICCAYVPTPGRSSSPRQVRRALRARLPAYMIPTRWRELEALPRNPNGKIDRPRIRDSFLSTGDDSLPRARRRHLARSPARSASPQ